MSQFTYTTKPNFLSDSKNIRISSGGSAEVHPTNMGWVGPAAGIPAKNISAAGLSFASSGAKSISAATYSNFKVTATSAAHGLKSGARVVIASSNPAGYDGTYTILVKDANTFVYDVPAALGAYVGSGTATGGVVTATCTGHGLRVGQKVLITNSVANTVAEGYNGYAEVISTADANTFTYNTVYTATTPGTLGKAASAATWLSSTGGAPGTGGTGTVTLTATAHGISATITPMVTVSGITGNTAYNTTAMAKVTGVNTLTYPLADPGAVAPTFTGTPLVSSYGEAYKAVEVIAACRDLKLAYDDAIVVPTFGTGVMTPVAGTLDISVGDAVVVTVTPTENMYVSGAPYIVLTLTGGITGQTRNAVYNAAASTETSLVFKYFVATADIAAGVTFTAAGATTGGYIGDILPTKRTQKATVTFTPPAGIAYTIQA